jgi:guanylate kinase
MPKSARRTTSKGVVPSGSSRQALPGRALLVVISGPSGVGKDSVLARLMGGGGQRRLATTATTRPRRAGEVDGRDYHFVTPQRFAEMEAAGELLENALVYGHRSGVPRAEVREALARGQDVLMRTDIQGVATIKAAVPQAITIFLAPASLAELAERLRRRGTDSEEQLRLRLAEAPREMDAASHFDYVVVNREGGLEQAVREIEAIMAAERQRTGRGPTVL